MESETAKIAYHVGVLQEKVANIHDMLKKVLNMMDNLNKKIADLEKENNDSK